MSGKYVFIYFVHYSRIYHRLNNSLVGPIFLSKWVIVTNQYKSVYSPFSDGDGQYTT